MSDLALGMSLDPLFYSFLSSTHSHVLSILFTSLNFKYTVRDFLCPCLWFLIDLKTIRIYAKVCFVNQWFALAYVNVHCNKYGKIRRN